jgi:tetratricopeptide (TPR) repeat protein
MNPRSLFPLLLFNIIFLSSNINAKDYKNLTVDSLEVLLQDAPKGEQKEIVKIIISKLGYSFPQKSLDYVNLLEELIDDDDSLSKVRIALGRYDSYYSLGNDSLENHFCRVADSLVTAYKKTSFYYRFYNARLMILSKRQNFLGALKCLQKIDSISLVHKDSLDHAMNLVNYGTMYGMMDSISLQHEYLLKANSYYKVFKSKMRVAILWTNLGLSYSEMDSLDKAMFYVGKLDSLYGTYKNKRVEGLILFLKSEILIKKGDYATALPIAKKSLEVNKELENREFIANSYLYIGKAYFYLKEYSNAVINIKECIALATKNDFVTIRILALPLLYQSYFEANDYKNAYKTIAQYLLISDSVQGEENAKTILGLREKYKTEKTEKENVLLGKQLLYETTEKEKVIAHRKFAIYSWAATAILLLLVAILFILFRKNSLQRRNINREKIKWLDQENYINDQLKTIAREKLEANRNLLNLTNNSLLQQTQLTEKLLDKLRALRPHSNKEGQKKIMESLAEISSLSTENNWKTFEQNFTISHPHFMKTLLNKHPNLSLGEKRLCAFLKMNLGTSEIMNVTMQSHHSIYGLKKRLRDKTGIEDNDGLLVYLQSL